ncbi:MAG: nickel-dependent lactate racemase, partial [Nitrososphaerales archaeon]|nr:nickel-dependent lactate racemase [Nitrososphaerales archaeon]
MLIMIVKLPVYAWYGDYEINIELPEEWEVHMCRMMGHDAPRLTDEQIYERLMKPIKSEPLHELARNKKECVIIVDDLTRPTKAYQLIPHILKELHDGGMKDENIRFVMAIGAHHWMRLDDIKKKLGDEIPERYKVFNHNVFENHVFLGKTSYGTPVYINKEVMKCDLKIGVGCILP